MARVAIAEHHHRPASFNPRGLTVVEDAHHRHLPKQCLRPFRDFFSGIQTNATPLEGF